MREKSNSILYACVLALVCVIAAATADAASPKKTAKQIIDATGLRGGLIVHVGCGDGKLSSALRVNDSYIVHGLDTDPRAVQSARETGLKTDSYGAVSFDSFDGKNLPYVENLVNLVVSEDLGGVDMKEVMRVLCPNGVAYIKSGGKWTKTVKPRPDNIDEWTHYLHDASGNAVAQDEVVAPPRHMQWVGSPKWSRHHDRMASMSALVSAGGRIFYIMDEGSTASIQMPDRRMLIARDAFNGVVLWKRPLSDWHTQLYPYKSGPAQLPRRLVAVDDRVYVTLGLEKPLTAIDATTGQTVRTYKGTQTTREVLHSEGVLFLLVSDTPCEGSDFCVVDRCMHLERNRVAADLTWNENERQLMAIEPESGKVLWSKKQRVVPISLAADKRGVYFHDGDRIIRLDRKTGDEIWRSEQVSRKDPIPTNFGPTLVVYDDVVLFSGGDRKMCALSLKDGKTLWSEKHPPSGHHSPEDLLVMKGLVWAGEVAGGRDSGIFTGRDLYTGEVKVEFPPDVNTYWFHHRCYRSKATVNYLLPSRTGIEFIDPDTKHWDTNHWVRGGCLYGIMPSNGMVYAPPHSCACYIDAKMFGFCALAPASSSRSVSFDVADKDRLEKGPAYGQLLKSNSDASAQDWPTYRHDSSRSGRTASLVSAKLDHKWQARVEGKLTSPVISAGKVFVASVDTHTVHALDAESGKEIWSFVTGGRVDSPPTIFRGRALFGSADGWVYCVKASDGTLIWRFRAAPVDRRLMAFEQLESVWPISGSVLIQDGVAYFVAGRSMFVDGGMRMFRLDPVTGRKISETVLDERDPDTGKNLQEHVKALNMPAALPDVLSSDGKYVYMRTQRFNLDGKRDHIAQTEVEDQDGEGLHLFSSVGFLDDTWFHRGYWMYGKSIASGASQWFLAGRRVPSGRILVNADSAIYGFGRKPEYFRWSTPQEYHLFAAEKSPKIIKVTNDTKAAQEKCQIPSTEIVHKWSVDVPILARAMVMAGDTIMIAGPPDIVDEEEVFKDFDDKKNQANMREQEAAYLGKKGGSLLAVSIEGKVLNEIKLDTLPVWDGMAVANGSLYMCTIDGRVICMKGEG